MHSHEWLADVQTKNSRHLLQACLVACGCVDQWSVVQDLALKQSTGLMSALCPESLVGNSHICTCTHVHTQRRNMHTPCLSTVYHQSEGDNFRFNYVRLPVALTEAQTPDF
jgi:hypothetical protein